MPVSYEVRGACAVIAMNHPPVNGFSLSLRQDLLAAVRRAESDAAIRALIITGSGKAFSGGADIAEFAAGKAFEAPSLVDICHIIEAVDKPVIAAINGVALGGGCELALGCHYRIGAPGVQIGLPEVSLGILPGAGGTQRMPRLIGVAAALDLIVSGRPLKAEQMAKLGFLDRIASGELIDEAVRYADELIAAGARPVRTSARTIDPASMPGGADAFFAEARTRIAKEAGPYPAPLKCVEAVEAAVRLPFADGMKTEFKLISELFATTEAKALQHAFFAERAAARIEGLPQGLTLRPIRRAAIIGAGTMGGGIAMAFINAGIPVVLLEVKHEALERGLGVIRGNYEATAKKGRMTAEQVEQRMAMISPSLSYDALADVDLVIEAVFEDMGLKETVFRTLDAVMKPGAILASNTSMLDLNRIAAVTSRPQDVIGMHFFSPANVMRLLEVVRGDKTAPEVLATTMQLARQIGKIGVVSGVCDGFIGNRMVDQYFRQAFFLCAEGATPQQVDGALERWGMAMGPFRMLDMAGADVSYLVRKRRYVEMPQLKYSKWADRVVELGRHGQKTNAGYYRYEPGNRKPLPDPIVEDIIVQYAAEQGITRRAISDEEIVARCIYALINEGAHIVGEGIAQRALDVDMVYLAGYAFPRYRGGPMFYADTLGLQKIVGDMQRFAANPYDDGAFWTPAPLLSQLAAAGGRFNR